MNTNTNSLNENISKPHSVHIINNSINGSTNSNSNSTNIIYNIYTSSTILNHILLISSTSTSTS
jgi:hypothetical protein